MSTRQSSPAPRVTEAARLCAALCAPLIALGCEERPHPWEGKDGPAIVLSAAPPRPPIAPIDPGGARGGAGGGDGGASPDPDVPALPVRVGGPWVRCYGNFRLSGDPLKDVTRLSLLCGPENGMWRLSARTLEGSVVEGQPGVTEKWKALRGACYRVFAVGDRNIRDLDVVVQSSRGATIASDGGEDAWPIVQPDRPFCSLEDDTVSVEITSRSGSGRFAAEVWVLKTPERHPPGAPRADSSADTYDDP